MTGGFTPVCTTEFIAFAQAYNDFAKLNVQLLGLSVDSNPSHLAWTYAIYMSTGVRPPFPIVADRTAEVAMLYGMIAPNASQSATVRNVFIVDPNQIIRAILIYPMTNGRSIPEIIRLVTALQTTDRDHVLTPANWRPGDETMIPAPQTYPQLLERQIDPLSKNLQCYDWYWCYNINQLPQ
jgi:peroxiredoxin (alkyl hydroperoxide reductase subunit C)